MSEIYCVRANFGQYTEHFLKGGYVAIGWLEEDDLSDVESRDGIYKRYTEYYDEESPYVIGQQVGQISRFLFDIQPGDYVITPAANTEYIHWGIVEDKGYYFNKEDDGCPYPHRRKVRWHKEPIQRSQFSVPFQNTIRASLTVYLISHKKNFFETIGKKELIPTEDLKERKSYYESILDKILELDYKEFEILITHILTALGFEAQHVGKVGDDGVDAVGELNIANMAKIKLFVQAKRYKLGSKIKANTVKALRQNIPFGGQGAFITTCDFEKQALEAAVDPGFPRIGTINGSQLIDILVEHWNDIPDDFQSKLGLRLGLVVE